MKCDIKLSFVVSYLQRNGWEIKPFTDFFITASIINKGKELKIIVPKLEELDDYDRRIYDIGRAVGALEGRSTEAVLNDIKNFGYDRESKT